MSSRIKLRLYISKKKAVLHGGTTQDRTMFIIDEQLSKITGFQKREFNNYKIFMVSRL